MLLEYDTTLQKQMREVVERGLTEGVTEFAQQYPEEITNLMALNKDKSTEEILAMVADTDRQAEWFKNAAMAGVVGGILGGGAGAINLGMQRAAHRQNVASVRQDAQMAVETGANANDIAGVINTNRGGHTYDIDAEGLMAYLQEAPDPAQAAAVLGLTVEDVQRAAENGEAVQVMAGEFTAMQAQDNTFVDKVGDYTDFNGNGYSPVNEKRQKELAQAYKQQAAERTLINEAFEAQLNELAVQMTAAGAKGNVAENFRKIMTQVALTYNPYDPTAYLRRHPLQFVSADSSGRVVLNDNGRTVTVNAGEGQQTNTQATGTATLNQNSLQTLDAQRLLEKHSDDFANVVDSFTNGTIDSSKRHFVMTTPLVFSTAGADILPIEITYSAIHKILNKHGDDMNAEILKQIPKALADPVMIFKTYSSKEGNEQIVVLVDLKTQPTDGRDPSSVVIPIELNVDSDNNIYQINDLTSAYGKTDKKLHQPSNKLFEVKIANSDVLYMSKQKTTRWANEAGLDLNQIIQSSGYTVNKNGAVESSTPSGLYLPTSVDANSSTSIIEFLNPDVKTEEDVQDLKERHPGYYQTALQQQEQLQQTAEKVIPGTVELNAVSAKDERSREYMRQALTSDKYGMNNDDVDGLFAVLDAIVERVETIAKEFPTMQAWQERDINDPNLLYRIFREEYKATFGANPTRSSFKKNGDYEQNFDLGTLCTKRESMDLIMQILSDEGYVQNLGPTQIEALKSLLKENGFLTACDICFVESKRVRALNDANKWSFEWKSVLLAAGINDDHEVGYNRELTTEQFNRLMELAGPNFNDAFEKYMPADRKRVKAGKTDLDTGITASKAKKIAQLMLQDSALANNFRPEWLLTARGTDWLVRSFAHTNLANTLASMFGAATAKPLEGFNIYDALSWYKDFDSKNINKEHIFDIGGFRAQSFTDFNAILFLDYVQMFIDLQARGLPLHTYTKVPAFVELFGETGAMINMSLVPEIVQGATKENAGLKKDENGNLVYAWASESFPLEKAMKLRKRSEYGGRVGTIAVGVSDRQIKMMLDDPNIDMIIPYHSSGMPASVKLKTGLNVAKDYSDFQNTKTGNGGKDTFSYNRALRELGDPRKAAQAYLDYCKENGFTSKFAAFKDHENYYKLLEDFRGYDESGAPVIQQPVRLKLPKNYEQLLRNALEDRSKQDKMRAEMKADSKLMEKARQIVTPQRLDGEVRDQLMKALKGALGSKNVFSLKQADFLDLLQAEYTSSLGEEAAASKVEVYRKGDGIVYGYAKDGKIYLNENYFNANTPAHEFTHVWAKVAQVKNPKLWEQGKELLKQSGEWQEVIGDPLYTDIISDEDAVASEVLARIVGRENEEYIRRLIDPNYKMPKGKALKEKIMAWVQEMFKAIRSIFDNADNLTYDEFIHMPLKTLWDSSGYRKFSSNVRSTIKQKPMTMAEIMAERKRLNNASDIQANEALTEAELRLERDNTEWNRLIEYFKTANKAQWKDKKDGRLYHLMDTPLVLQLPNINAAKLPLDVYGSFFKHSVRADHPGMTYSLLKDLPKLLADPVLIYKSDDKFIALLDKFDTNGAPMIASIELNKDNKKFIVNLVNSVYGKDEKISKGAFIPSFIKLFDAMRGNIVYINKKRSADWVGAIRNQYPMGVLLHQSASFDSNIHDETDLVKLKKQNPGYYQEKTTTTKGYFNPVEGIIGLFKGADASTVIHEGGHFFVENLINDVLSGDCTELQQKDAEALMKYCGITLEQWQGMSVEERRPYHEKMAEAFESYIIQGVAPSKALRSVFRKFADWLTKVYKLARGEYKGPNRNPNAAEITPEVMAVFDHMLASQEEIEQAERLRGYMNKMPKVVTDNLSEGAKKMLEDAIRNAHDKAVELLTKESMANFSKERRAKIADLKEQLLEPITNQVKQEPLYAAGIELEGHFAKPRRRAGTLAKQYLAEEAKEEFKAQFDMIAEMYGFSSGSELAQALQNAPTMAQAVKERIDTEVQKQYPDVMAERKLAEEKAREALNNDETGIVIGLEMVLLEEA